MNRAQALTLILLAFVASQCVHGQQATITGQYGHESHGDHEGSDGYGDSSGPHEPSYGGTHYGEDCPVPQPPTAVTQAYLAHGKFIWRELSAQVALRGSGALASGVTTIKPKAPQRKASSFVQPRPKPANANATNAMSVTSPDWLLPVRAVESGVGFQGAVDPRAIPTDEALAVAHYPTDPDLEVVVHGVNDVFEVFFATKDGKSSASPWPTRIPLLDMMMTTGLDLTNLAPKGPSAWYDTKEERWTLLWTSYVKEGTVSRPAPLFLAVSEGANPLGGWIVWALNAVPATGPGAEYCGPKSSAREAFSATNPQGSFSDDGIFISIGALCDNANFLSTLFVYSKAALYAKPSTESGGSINIYAATYLASASWYFSVPPQLSAMIEDPYKPFNNYIRPARPQTTKDMDNAPLFVLKVDDAFLSVATLTGEPLEKMTDVATAPKLVATIVGKGNDFNNEYGPEGSPVMLQPGTEVKLDAGDVGMVRSASGVRIYWAVHHEGLLYITTSEYFGAGKARIPSIYWAIIDPNSGLCKLSRKDWGLVASEGLALAYPVIAANVEGGATLAFSYSGDGVLPEDLGAAYAGVATTVVGAGYSEHGPEAINIVKRGTVSITKGNTDTSIAPWGDYSAASYMSGKMWFAAPIAKTTEVDGAKTDYSSWISVIEL